MDPVNPQVEVASTVTSHTESVEKNNKSKFKTLWISGAVLLLIGIVWAVLWLLYFQYYESTDDAYVNGNLVRINSAIEGSIISYAAEDTDFVREGQILVQLDPTKYQVNLEKELAALSAAVLNVRQLYDRVLANRAQVERQQAMTAKAKYDFENRARLVDSRAISNEDFVHAQEDYLIAKLMQKQAEYELDVSLDAIGPFPITSHPLIEEQKSKVIQAFYQLKHCTIYAPCTGFIAQRTVQVGQSVSPSTALMGVIPETQLWVDANFKETQLKYMRIGQKVNLWLDLYGSKTLYKGTVLGIASGTGSVFSLIPPQNATGNWIKIVQRLPVRISLDPELLKNYPARLGLSANVTVDISVQSLPMLSPAPTDKHLTATPVFNLDLKEIDQEMDGLILHAFKQSPHLAWDIQNE